MEEHDATNVGDRGSSPLWDILSSRSLMDRQQIKIETTFWVFLYIFLFQKII